MLNYPNLLVYDRILVTVPGRTSGLANRKLLQPRCDKLIMNRSEYVGSIPTKAQIELYNLFNYIIK